MPHRAVYAVAAVAAAVLSFVVAVARPDSGDGAVALDGASLFRAKGCSSCHAGPDSPSMTGVAPSLAEAPAWAGDRIEGVAAEEYVEQSMRNPSAFISPAAGGGVSMPLLQLSDGEIDALVDYLLAR